MNNSLVEYIMHIADNALIHGHRLSEWCGHGPILEVDMALSNFALDDIGAARNFYSYAAEIEGNGKTEDSYPYHRDARKYRNCLLVELPNGNFADTIAKCFFLDAYQFLFYTQLKNSSDKNIAAIAEKSLKEVTYHLRFSSEWVVRLGDGTSDSKQKMQKAINEHWEYTGELFQASAIEKEMLAKGIAPDISLLKTDWTNLISKTIEEATLAFPLSVENKWFQSGGKTGNHTEYLGFILAELQHLQKSYPNCEW